MFTMFTITIGKSNSLIFGTFSSVKAAEECLRSVGWKKKDSNSTRERIHGPEFGPAYPWTKNRRRAYIEPIRKVKGLKDVE